MPTGLPLSFSGSEILAVSVTRVAPAVFTLSISVQSADASAFTVVLARISDHPDLDTLFGASRVFIEDQTGSLREFGRIHLEASAEANHELWADAVSVTSP